MSAAPPRHKFIVYAPNMTDEGALQRRLSVRPAHLQRAKEEIAKGVISAFLTYQRASRCTHSRWG